MMKKGTFEKICVNRHIPLQQEKRHNSQKVCKTTRFNYLEILKRAHFWLIMKGAFFRKILKRAFFPLTIYTWLFSNKIGVVPVLNQLLRCARFEPFFETCQFSYEGSVYCQQIMIIIIDFPPSNHSCINPKQFLKKEIRHI